MTITQTILIIQAFLILIGMGIGYWVEEGLFGIFAGWLLATLATVTLHEILVSIAGGI